MTHALAEDVVTFDSDASRSAQLLLDKARYRTPPAPRWNSPDAERRLKKYWKPLAFYLPQSIGAILPNPWNADGVLFLHRRDVPNGDSRLVTIWIKLRNVHTQIDYDLEVIAAAYSPATWTPGSKLTLIPTSISTWHHNLQYPPLRFFAGQPDPADPTHFTIRYELSGQQGTIDGYLRGPDQDHPTEHIVLDARDGPLDSIHGL